MHRSDARPWLTLALALLALGCSAGGNRPGSRADGSTTPPTGRDAGPSEFRCEPGASGCLGNLYYECGADGRSRAFETQCEEACDPTLRCVSCRPGTRRCDGTVSSFCAPDGRRWVSGRDCAEWGSTCNADGFCGDACADAERSSSNVGCEYWPTPLANTGELARDTFDYRVVVANPNDTPANVRVRRGTSEVWSGTISARGLQEISLPWIDEQSFGLGEGSWNSIVVANGAYRLTSDVPVIASQFNPFEYNVGDAFSYTNDATLLYPSHVLTGDYVGASYAPLSRMTGTEGGLGGSLSSIRYGGYVAVVGVSREPTRVEVTARGNVAADARGRFPATPVGGTFAFTLQQGEVAHIAAAPPPECGRSRPGFMEERDCETVFGMEMCDVFQTCREDQHDLTGTRIAADRPVAVFGGHVCAYVPTSAQACDHLEVMMPPMQSWGRSYVSAPMGDGSLAGVNVVRVLPAFEATTVTVSPPQGGVSGRTLSPGEYLEFEATTPFEVQGSSAILVAQYLRGQYATNPASDRGDPALTVLVPAEQYRSDYTFILPSSYNPSTNGQNHLLIVRSPGVPLTLDGGPVEASWQRIGAREIGVVLLDGGAHAISGAEPFGLVAYGLGSFTSYATPAGLNLTPITILF
jgi:hypothetical protein